MGDVVNYLETITDPARRTALERVVARAHELVPDLAEATSYGMPTLRYRGKALLSAISTAKHLAYYPHSGSVVSDVAAQLAGFSMSSGTVRFTVGQPIPDDALDALILRRRDEIDDQVSRSRR